VVDDIEASLREKSPIFREVQNDDLPVDANADVSDGVTNPPPSPRFSGWDSLAD